MEEEQTGCSVQPCPAPVILQSFLLTCHPPVCQQPSQQRRRRRESDRWRGRGGERERERERKNASNATPERFMLMFIIRQNHIQFPKKIKSIVQSHITHTNRHKSAHAYTQTYLAPVTKRVCLTVLLE